MPPLSEWFDGRLAVAAFIANAVFAAAGPHGLELRPGWCNGQPAVASYEPVPDGSIVAGGLQILEVRERQGLPLVTDIISYRDPGLATR